MRGVVVVAGLLVLLGVGIPSRAQDGPPPVETVVRYYEDEHPDFLGHWLWRWNVCFERFVTLNPEIEFDNIPYGTRVLLPKNEPCYDMSLPGEPPRLKYYEAGKWLAEPYYSHEVQYIYSDREKSFEEIQHKYNICFDDLIAENQALASYGERYFNLWRSLDIFIPADAKSCDLEQTVDRTVPLWLSRMRVGQSNPIYVFEEGSVCPESLLIQWTGVYGNGGTPYRYRGEIPSLGPSLPCYNEQGQRLIYFDLSGHPLDKPVYSDLRIYRVQPGKTLPEIAEFFGVCLNDLISLNYFPDLPIVSREIEVFIPEARACPEDIRAQLVGNDDVGYPRTLHDISMLLNSCVEDLQPYNPHLHTLEGLARLRPYEKPRAAVWVLVPETLEPCYTTLHLDRDKSIYDVERELNICHEMFIYERFSYVPEGEPLILSMRRDSQPCYTEHGQRMRYTSQPTSWHIPTAAHPYAAFYGVSTGYSDMPVHVFERDDTVYSVSRKYNVCVRELLLANPMLLDAMPERFPTFIPETRPCYDEATGMPLIYEDESGVPLPEPRVGDKLIYYGTQPFGRVSYYYNVCQNRIEEANAAKLSGEAHYLGWIIPHDRPPCYDADGYPIDYALKQHEESGGIVHTVQYAETLSEIAARYDKSIYWIADANNLSSVDMIWTEQRLIIPGGVTTRDVKLISAALIGLAAVGAVVMWRRR